MFTLLVRLSAAAGVCLVCAAPMLAQDLTPVEVAKKGKAAIAIIQTKGKTTSPLGPGAGPPGGLVPPAGFKGGFTKTTSMFAPAFCVHPAGLFLTSYSNAPGDSAQIIIHPGSQNQQTFNAPVVRADKDAGLALIWAPAASNLSALPIGSPTDLADAVDVVACGLPPRITAAAAFGTIASPNLVIKSGKVASSDKLLGNYFRVSVNPGGSGGPVLDSRGRVIGMVAGEGSDGPLAIRCDHLQQFLTGPVLVTGIPPITVETMHQPLEFEAMVVDLFPKAKPAPFDLELVVQADGDKEQRYKMTIKDGLYRVTAVPLPAPREKPRFDITVAFPDGTVVGTITEQTVQVDGKACPLSSLRMVRNQGDKTTILFADGIRAMIKPSALPTVSVSLGGGTWNLDLARASEVRIEPTQQLPNISCTVVVQQQGKETARVQKQIILTTANNSGKNLANVDPEVLELAKRMVELTFDRSDTNQDGKIHRDEASAALARQFADYDRDNDGFLTRDEYLHYVINVYAERNSTTGPRFSK
jgi:hypothetical protein